LDGLIVTNPINIYYLSGFKGISLTERESILVFSPKPTLITARLYQNEANKLLSKNFDVLIVDERKQIQEGIKKLLFNQKKIGFESQDLKYEEFLSYNKLLKNTSLVATKKLIEELRLLKTTKELEYIEKAQLISQKAFESLIKAIKMGQTEAEIADLLAKIIKNLGGQGLAFDSIIASGKNSALPHYVTGDKKIKSGEVLLMDFGAKYKDCCADLSRTIFIGKAKDEQKKIYNHVQFAQDSAISKIHNNVKATDVFYTANNIFKKQKLEKNFIHGLGHGVGLEVHESPSLSRKSKDSLNTGMVFSVEPGLYFPSWGGVRIEDLVTIKNDKANFLGKKAEFIEIH